MAYTNECDNNKQISITNHFKSIHSFKSKTEEDERRRISKREKITNRCRRRTSERAYQVQSYRRALNIQCTQVLFFLANAWTCFRCLRSWCCSSRDRTFVFIDFWTSGWWLIYDDDGLLISWFRMSLKKRVRVCAWWYVLMITSSLVIGQTSRSMACFSAMALVWPNAGTVWTRARVVLNVQSAQTVSRKRRADVDEVFRQCGCSRVCHQSALLRERSRSQSLHLNGLSQVCAWRRAVKSCALKHALLHVPRHASGVTSAWVFKWTASNRFVDRTFCDTPCILPYRSFSSFFFLASFCLLISESHPLTGSTSVHRFQVSTESIGRGRI